LKSLSCLLGFVFLSRHEEQTGDRLVLRNHGMKNIKTGRYGDLYIFIFVKTPTSLTKRQEELLTELGEIQGDHATIYKKEQTPFDKVKDYIKRNLR